MTATIDGEAPANAKGSIRIDAPPETVWAIISDIDGWPKWNPDVSDATIDGDLVPGTVFVWKAGPGRIRSTLSEVDPPRRIAWTGKTLGIAAIHTWEIRPDNGGVQLATEESWDGLPVRLFRRTMQRTLDRSIASGLEAAKQAAELDANSPG